MTTLRLILTEVRHERGSDLPSNTSTATLIYLPANQMCRTYPINQSNCLEIGKRQR